MACSKFIKADILNDKCVEDMKKGLENNAYIFHRSDIDWATVTQAGFVITKLALKAGKRGFRVRTTLRDPFTGTKNSSANINTGVEITREVPIVFGSNSAENADTISALMDDEFVMFIEAKAKGKDLLKSQAFVAFGWEQGLKHESGEQDYYGDNGAGFMLIMQEKEATAPYILYNETDYATSLAKLDSLCAAPAGM